jgi:hypothetical protein
MAAAKTEYEHKFIHHSVASDTDRARYADWLNNHSRDGWVIVNAAFTPGGVFDVLLKRPVQEEPAK